jgi:hypothetical protein
LFLDYELKIKKEAMEDFETRERQKRESFLEKGQNNQPAAERQRQPDRERYEDESTGYGRVRNETRYDEKYYQDPRGTRGSGSRYAKGPDSGFEGSRGTSSVGVHEAEVERPGAGGGRNSEEFYYGDQMRIRVSGNRRGAERPDSYVTFDGPRHRKGESR